MGNTLFTLQVYNGRLSSPPCDVLLCVTYSVSMTYHLNHLNIGSYLGNGYVESTVRMDNCTPCYYHHVDIL